MGRGTKFRSQPQECDDGRPRWKGQRTGQRQGARLRVVYGKQAQSPPTGFPCSAIGVEPGCWSAPLIDVGLARISEATFLHVHERKGAALPAGQMARTGVVSWTGSCRTWAEETRHVPRPRCIVGPAMAARDAGWSCRNLSKIPAVMRSPAASVRAPKGGQWGASEGSSHATADGTTARPLRFPAACVTTA